MRERKQYSAEERGVVVTCKRHGVDLTTYYLWKELYSSKGIEGLKKHK